MFKLFLVLFFSGLFTSYLVMSILKSPKFEKNFEEGSCTKKAPDTSPIKPQEWTLEELSSYNGVEKTAILVAIDWRVFDTTSARNLYGPGGPYHNLAGRDATRNVVLMSDVVCKDFDDYTDFTAEQRDSLNSWVEFFYSKYPEVGLLVRQKENPNHETHSPYGSRPSGGIVGKLEFTTGFNQ